MSEMAKEARRKARDKVYALVNPKPESVDASDYGPEETDMDTYKKTGKQPIGRQQYRKGGKVVSAEGEKAKVHAGRKPRAGMKVRLGEKHPDAIEDKKLIDKIVKPSARTDSRIGKSTGGDLALAAASPAGFAAKELGLATGGKASSRHKPGQYVDGGTRKSLEMGDAARGAVKGQPHKKENGIMVPARDKRASGGGAGQPASGKPFDPNEGSPFFVHNNRSGDRVGGPYQTVKRARGAVVKHDNQYGGYAHGIIDSSGRERFKKGGEVERTERASGGRTKGKTDINIIIGAGAKPADPMMPPLGAAPVPPPMPNAIMPGTSPAPVGAGAPPPMGPTGVPMARKSGGRAIDMKFGAGGGEGRLEKARKY